MPRQYWLLVLVLFILAVYLVVRGDYLDGVTDHQSVEYGLSTPIPTFSANPLFPKVPANKLDLSLLLDQDVTWLNKYDSSKIITLTSGGDVIPARSGNAAAVKHNDFHYSYQEIAPYFKAADLALINFETPLVANCPTTLEGMIFCGDERQLEGLASMGLDVVSLANNHAGNWGISGIENTVRLFNSAGADVVGLGAAVIKRVNDTSFGFLAYNDIPGGIPPIAEAQTEIIESDIKSLSEQVDVVVVMFHWGNEYTRQPNTRQKELAYTAVDSGADLIIGNHPHWLQSMEIYQNKLISYAWGNLVFDQMWSEETKIGLLAQYYFYEDKLVDIFLVPIYMADYGKPIVVEDEALKQNILDRVRNSSLLP